MISDPAADAALRGLSLRSEGLSQQQIGDTLGVTQKTVSNDLISNSSNEDPVPTITNASALLGLLDQGTRPPCADGTDRWTDEDHEVRNKVAPHCDDCPIRPRCHDFADTARPRITFGIFAGIDYTRKA